MELSGIEGNENGCKKIELEGNGNGNEKEQKSESNEKGMELEGKVRFFVT